MLPRSKSIMEQLVYLSDRQRPTVAMGHLGAAGAHSSDTKPAFVGFGSSCLTFVRLRRLVRSAQGMRHKPAFVPRF